MRNELTVPCQYRSGTIACGNKTKSPTGLCPKHRNSMPLHDINAGTGKPSLLTAIPRSGTPITTSYEYTTNEPDSNEETANMLADQEVEETSTSAVKAAKEKRFPGRTGKVGALFVETIENEIRTIRGIVTGYDHFKFGDFMSRDRKEIREAKDQFRNAKAEIPFGQNRERMIKAAEQKIIKNLSPHLREKYAEKGL